MVRTERDCRNKNQSKHLFSVIPQRIDYLLARMQLLPSENMLRTCTLVMVSIQLFSSFGKLNGIGLPLELLQEPMGFARRMTFPLANSDTGVELPPNIDDNIKLKASNDFDSTGNEHNGDSQNDLPTKSELPQWVQQMQQQAEIQQNAANHYHSKNLPKHLSSGKHHQDNRQTTNTITSALKRCSIEISSKIPGICQGMGSFGNACVSGDYMDVFNAECL